MLQRTKAKLTERGLRWVSAEPFRVRVMARAERYAMVRRPHCNPFVCLAHELRPMQ